jgi:hypothetical protein
MKTCIGEQYQGQFQQYASINGWHGCFGHLNVLTKDHDDICTHYGKHDRVVTFLPQYEKNLNATAIYVRVDHVWNLGMPTQSQIIDIIRKHDGTTGKWQIVSAFKGDNNSTDIFLTKRVNK